MLTSIPTFNVKIQPQDTTAPRTKRRILLHTESLRAVGAVAGDVVIITQSPQHDLESTQLGKYAVGIAWPSPDIQPDGVGISESHSLTAQLENGTTAVALTLKDACVRYPHLKASSNLPHAQTIKLQQVLEKVPITSHKNHSQKDGEPQTRKDWLSLAARELLIDLRYITNAQIVELPYEGATWRLSVRSIIPADDPENTSRVGLENGMQALSLVDGSPQSATLWTVDWGTTVEIVKPDEAKIVPSETTKQSIPSLDTPYAKVGGLDKQIEEVRDLIEIPLTKPNLFRRFGLKPPRGILLHGPPGTGKTHLASAIARSSNAFLLTISGPELSSAFHGETELKLRNVFVQAKANSPCVIVIDEVDTLCPRREDTGGGVESRVVATLLTLMDGMDDPGDSELCDEDVTRIVVVATTNRPNAIDPALRRPGRFDREIEIGIPDVQGRLSILNVLLNKTPNSITPEQLGAIAKSTHGYVGADLAAVVREAGTRAIKRSLTAPDAQSMVVTQDDILHATTQIQPSALREHYIESPAVKWSDIGGQAVVKQKLKESVEWPLTHPEAFKRLGVVPPKGVLLYGPPGCSKTLTAKALATESGINFIAVKGPELLNKYVGESERAVREIFRKARAAAPSIIFFDEIDALGSSRASGETGGNHEGVLTSLLNEMDGIQELTGVTVVAATNRPDVIDSALMRPGRLDRILYVGPPDRESRLDILKIRVAKMAVDPALDLNELVDLTEGCSGAEIVSLCQSAALSTMQKDIDAPFVLKEDFTEAARTIRRQITKDMVRHYEEWRERSGINSA